MLRYLMTIIRELYLYLAKVKTLGKITSCYILGDGAACRAACVLCAVQTTHMRTIRQMERQKYRRTDGQSERQMDRHEKANSLFAIFLT